LAIRIRDAFVLSFAIWFVRLVNEGVNFPATWQEQMWLLILRPLIIVVLGYWFAALYVRLYESLTPKKFMNGAFGFAAIFCLPYVPDMYASFVKAGEKKAVLLSIGFYCLGILTYGLIRGGGCLFISKLVFPDRKISRKRNVVTYASFLIFEYFFFHTWHPITYFPALPLPLPAARFETASDASPTKYILLQTMIDGDSRQKIHQGSFAALSILGQKMADELREKLRGRAVAESVVVILPETFVALDDVEDAGILLDPVASVLFSDFKVENVVWIQGAFVRNNNLVIGTELNRPVPGADPGLVRRNSMTILRQKREHMPMFEAPSKGISYSTSPEEKNFIEDHPPAEHARLIEFLREHKILVCYESLFPANWTFGKSTLVLTNHHLFNEFRLMNWVYFGFLRQLSFAFGSRVKIVSNYNDSGVLNPISSVVSGSSSGQEGWFALRLP
jgi:hypothetical protein